MTQPEMVIEHLLMHGSITPKEADDCYGITRLADVIYKLKKRGMSITTVIEHGENRFGKPVTWAKYVKEN